MAKHEMNPYELTTAFGAHGARPLGAGTFGETWLLDGIDGTDEARAVKVLRPELFDPSSARREIDGLERFDHPGVVKLFEVRGVSLGGVDHLALICEYIDGGDVANQLQSGAMPSHKAVRRFGRALLTALAELHESDTVHRDVKPGNVLLRDGKWSKPVLIDFGLSRTLTEATLTAYPQAIGSTSYMAPEVLRGEKGRKAADLWAVGVILYRLLSGGDHPFGLRGGQLSPEQAAEFVVGSPRALPDDVPEDLAEVTLRLLSEVAYKRGSAERAASDLEEES